MRVSTKKEFYWNTLKNSVVEVAIIHTLKNGDEEVEYFNEEINLSIYQMEDKNDVCKTI